jgi:L-alanine-DL-glutamate epimerase-like enolase superfamily enzyme
MPTAKTTLHPAYAIHAQNKKALAFCLAIRRQRSNSVKLAGGEGAYNVAMAQHLMEYGSVGSIQIDCGRIGGIGPAKTVADDAVARDIIFVNHTFTSYLALSASLQPFAGLADHRICEYPFAPKKLASELTLNHLPQDSIGEVAAPDGPGLGITINMEAIRNHLQEVEIKVNGRVLYTHPHLESDSDLMCNDLSA